MTATATDSMLARLQADIEEKRSFQEQLISGAQKQGRDLTPEELDLYQRASDEMKLREGQLTPLREGARIAAQSAQKTAELQDAFVAARNPQAMLGKVEYRSAGVYIADLYLSQLGADDASQRLDLFHRAAAHQTMADNPGLLPESIVGPVVEYVDNSRPVVATIGTTDLGPGSWSYARITQHTLVAQQTAEKAELASRKMTITKTPITAPTLGGYVNVSKQDISRSQPQILDMIIADLANEYARQTEQAAGTVLIAGATAGPVIPTGPTTAAAVNTALWTAAATAYGGVKNAGRLVLAVSPDMLGLVGPLFAPYNPQNAYSSGFNAGSFGSGAMGAISGITVVMSPMLPAGTMLVINTAAVKIFEMRYGSLQVNEPSVWGVQVGYAGDFQTIIIEATGVVKITKTP